jgi:hypothetical protein
MAKAGDELINPVTGLRTIFRQTARDTGGELLQVDWIGGPGWEAGPDHVHRRQEERFEILSGRLGSRVAGIERLHEAGDVAVDQLRDATCSRTGRVRATWPDTCGSSRTQCNELLMRRRAK